MYQKYKVYANRISFENKDVSLLHIQEELQRFPYKRDSDAGVVYAEAEDDVLELKIILRTPTYITDYNADTSLFEKRIVFLFDEVNVYIDFDANLIYTFCSSTKFNKAKSFLRRCLRESFLLSNIELSPNNVMVELQEIGYNPEITNMVIKRFEYLDGAIGKFSPQITNAKIGNELLCNNKENVSKITFKVVSNDYADFVLSINMQNTFSLECKEDEFWNIFNSLKFICNG